MRINELFNYIQFTYMFGFPVKQIKLYKDFAGDFAKEYQMFKTDILPEASTLYGIPTVEDQYIPYGYVMLMYEYAFPMLFKIKD